MSIERNISTNIGKNYDKISKYLEPNFEVFCDLDGIIYEVNQCLLLGLHKASITLTNYLLERLLKLALIYNAAGLDPVQDLNELDAKFEGPNKEFGSIVMNESIQRCKKFKLITDSESDVLHKTIRALLRNGFAHADSSEILKDVPDESKMYQGSFSNPNAELKEVTINTKINPTFQALHMSDYAMHQALPYYDFVYNLIVRIEKRLKNKAN